MVWFFRAVIRKDRLNFIKNHLVAAGLLDEGDDRNIAEFVDAYLKQDGAFVLRLIAHNTNSVTTSDIIAVLWMNWKEREDVKDRDGNDDDTLPLASWPNKGILKDKSKAKEELSNDGSCQV